MNRRLPRAGDGRLSKGSRKMGRHESLAIALEHYIQRRHQLEILSLFGTFDFRRALRLQEGAMGESAGEWPG